MNINFSTHGGFFRWNPAAWLRVTGADALPFLQGQFTNDLRPLAAPGAEAVYGLWLTVKGKVLADSFVLRGEGAGEYWVRSYFSPAVVIRERLESHVIADDVQIEDETVGWAGVSVLGAEVEAGSPDPAGGARACHFRGRRERGGNHEWVYRPASGAPPWLDEGAGCACDEAAMEWRRIESGIPAVPGDLGPGDLPNEAGIEGECISYTKGCYLGQEVMARLKAMGQVRRRLVRVEGAVDAPPPPGAPLFIGGRQAGEMRTAARGASGQWIGWAMVSRALVVGGARLSLSVEGEAVLRVRDEP